MDDLARLQIRVQSLEVEVADKRLKGLSTSGAQAERATDKLMGTMKRFIGPAVAAAAAVSSLRKVVNVTREFDVLNAQLITATGSSQNAAQAFEAIQDFAANTPYDLAQVTDSFTKLVNLGLNPSEAALESYGNTASAMGKDLNQLIEAVADAATGEFERLKEFGIKSKSEGDRVSFTFRGITTTVGKNAAEIEQYLQDLGNNEFAGAMAQRMDSLDGALSNLGDSWDTLFRNISDLGVGDVIEEAVRTAIDALDELNAMLSSGELEGYLSAIAFKFQGFANDVALVAYDIKDIWDSVFATDVGGGIAYATTETIKFIVKAFKELPENLRATIKILAVEYFSIVDQEKEFISRIGSVIAIGMSALVDKAIAYGKAIANALNPFSDEDFNLDDALAQVSAKADAAISEVMAKSEARMEALRTARRESIIVIMDERDAALKSFDEQYKAAEKLRKKFDEDAAARRNAGGDRLEQFGLGADPKDKGPSAADKKAEEAREKEFDKLVESLRTEEEVIQESYTRRLAIILENTEEGSVKQAELKKRLNEEFATSALGDLATPDTYQEQLDQLEAFFLARKELILENTALTEEERTALEEELTANRNERLQALESERMAVIYGNTAELFDSLTGLAKTFGGEQSSAYKALFAVSKAFSLASSIMSIQTGIAKAVELGWPAAIPAVASVISTTAGVVSTIQGTQFSGAYDNGGVIPQGSIGLVGEFGPELVAGPTNVRSRRETAEIFKEAGQADNSAQSPMTAPTIKIINLVDPSLVASYMNSDDGSEAVLNIITANPETVKAASAAA